MRTLRVVPPAANTHPHVFQPTRSYGCQGFAKSTQVQCKKRSLLRSSYCERHTAQEGKCFAFGRDGWKCNYSIVLNGRGFFCERHETWATPFERKCHGLMRDNSPCYRRVTRPDYAYCMTAHDPRVNNIDPKFFRQPNLRNRMFGRLMVRDGDRDLYDPNTTLPNPAACEVEHIGELQFAAFTCQFLNSEDRNGIVAYYRDEILNELPNLCITRKATNEKKGRASTSALQDMMVYSLTTCSYGGRLDVRALDNIRDAAFHSPIVATFNDQLRNEGLSRESTKAIRRETKRALKWSRDKFLNQGESPIYAELGQLTQKLYTALDI